MINYKNLGKKIQSYRKEKGLTQQQLSDLVDVVPSNISHIERGTNKVSLPTLVRIASALDVTLDQLMFATIYETKYALNDELAELTDDCTQDELETIIDVIKILKKAIKG